MKGEEHIMSKLMKKTVNVASVVLKTLKIIATIAAFIIIPGSGIYVVYKLLRKIFRLWPSRQNYSQVAC